LGDVCKFITDGTHQTPVYCDASIGYPFLSSKNVTTGKIDWANIKFIPKELHNELYKRLSPRLNDVLLAKNGTTGVAALVDRDYVFDIYVSLALLRPSEVIDPLYLLNVINSPSSKRQFDAHLKGIGVPNLHLKDIRNTLIPLPPLPVQQKIADVLDRASALIEKRNAQIAKLDLLVKSRFIEMFGDPVMNPMGWETAKMEAVAPTRSYRENIESDNDNFWLLNLDMVEAQTGRILKKVLVCKEEINSSTTAFCTENVLYSKLRPYLNKVILPDDCGYCTTELLPLLPQKGKLNKVFLAELLRGNEFVKYIQDKVAGTKMPRVQMDVFRNYYVIIPPLSLQNRFAEFVRAADKSKAEMQRGLDKLELLYKSLMQSYFSEEI
jgi:type I restriction enzyme S subunit